jgi:hypothetical protein
MSFNILIKGEYLRMNFWARSSQQVIDLGGIVSNHRFALSLKEMGTFGFLGHR